MYEDRDTLIEQSITLIEWSHLPISVNESQRIHETSSKYQRSLHGVYA